MPAAVVNPYKGAPTPSGGVTQCSVTRAAGEAIVIGYLYEYNFGEVKPIGSAVWDSAGDNQALTLVQLQRMNDAANRWLAVYELKSPTSAKTANVTFTHTGANTDPDNAAYIAATIRDFDSATWVRASNKRFESAPGTNDLPITQTTTAGDLMLAFATIRNENIYTNAGDALGYQEQSSGASSRTMLFGYKDAVGSSTTITFGYDDATNFDTALVSLSIAGGVTAPTVATQPAAQTATAPAAATFTASVTGTFSGLRWQRQAAGAGGWTDVPGATSASFTTGATSVTGGSWNDTDRVRLQVDWSGGTVTSTDVALTVVAGGTAPAITVQPANASVTTPATNTFSVTATGSGTLTYQWQRQPAAGGGYVNISGATAASYTTQATSVTGGAANNGDTYRCVVTGDTAPPATSTAATLTVLAPLATTFTFTINGAVSLTGLKYAIFEATTPDAWVAPILKGANETTDASGACSVSVTGLTTRRVGELGSAFVTNSDGTATGGAQAATRRATYYVGAFA